MRRNPHRGKLTYLVIAILMVGALSLLAQYHALEATQSRTVLVIIDVLGFIWIASTLAASYMHQDVRVTKRQQHQLDFLRVSVMVPTYNEDPAVFRAMLDSVAAQTRQVQRLHVVDDGSKTDDCERAFWQWYANKPADLEAIYTRIPNSKKRHAQSVAFEADELADIWVTLDSDTVLREDAIENGLKPFSRRKVTAVAGLLVSLNDDKNLLTRLVDLGFTMSFLNGRAAWSLLKSVVVSCGGLAFYRGEVIRKYLDVYLTQTVWGRKVASGDDRMLTCYALQEGHTVLQESSMGYTLMPENLSHLTRQRVRWWRSFFWGGGWLIQNFSIRKPAWWLVTWQFVSFVLFTFALPMVLIVGPIRTAHFPWEFFVYTAVLSYITSLKFLTMKRPDRTATQRFITWLLAPLSSLLHLYLCSVLQYVGLFTFLKTGWSTRQTVEVGIASAEINDTVPMTTV
jgi:Glycosyltransferases, probably involved in cell wall biogenesis